MAYLKYKEVTKYFNFSKVIDKSSIPDYIKQYIFEDEQIWTAYKTSRDHGIFTNSKIILFDNFSNFGLQKQIYTIPYKSISTISIIFGERSAELNLFLDSGYPERLKFVNMKGEDKLRLRILYTCISRVINNQKLVEADVIRLINDDIHFIK